MDYSEIERIEGIIEDISGAFEEKLDLIVGVLCEIRDNLQRVNEEEREKKTEKRKEADENAEEKESVVDISNPKPKDIPGFRFGAGFGEGKEAETEKSLNQTIARIFGNI